MTYKEYFSSLSMSNIDILSFIEGDDSHFFSTSFDIPTPALMLHSYNYKLQDNNADQCFKIRTAGFTIMKSVKDKTDYSVLESAFVDCELIGDEVINKIKFDQRNRANDLIRIFNLSTVTTERLLNKDGLCGVQFQFEIQSAHNTNINVLKWQ